MQLSASLPGGIGPSPSPRDRIKFQGNLEPGYLVDEDTVAVFMFLAVNVGYTSF